MQSRLKQHQNILIIQLISFKEKEDLTFLRYLLAYFERLSNFQVLLFERIVQLQFTDQLTRFRLHASQVKWRFIEPGLLQVNYGLNICVAADGRIGISSISSIVLKNYRLFLVFGKVPFVGYYSPSSAPTFILFGVAIYIPFCMLAGLQVYSLLCIFPSQTQLQAVGIVCSAADEQGAFGLKKMEHQFENNQKDHYNEWTKDSIDPKFTLRSCFLFSLGRTYGSRPFLLRGEWYIFFPLLPHVSVQARPILQSIILLRCAVRVLSSFWHKRYQNQNIHGFGSDLEPSTQKIYQHEGQIAIQYYPYCTLKLYHSNSWFNHVSANLPLKTALPNFVDS